MNPGTYKARGISAALEKSSKKGTDQVRVTFKTEDGSRLDWFGYFTPDTEARTLESLLLCGWNGEDFVKFTGIDTRDVLLVCENELYEGKTRLKVQWVNDPNRTVGGKPMESAEVVSFADRMRAKVAALKAQQGGPTMGGTSFDFGANAPGERDVKFGAPTGK